jgi:hypothetical protein
MSFAPRSLGEPRITCPSSSTSSSPRRRGARPLRGRSRWQASRRPSGADDPGAAGGGRCAPRRRARASSARRGECEGERPCAA